VTKLIYKIHNLGSSKQIDV